MFNELIAAISTNLLALVSNAQSHIGRPALSLSTALPRVVWIPTTFKFDDAITLPDQILTRLQRAEVHCQALLIGDAELLFNAVVAAIDKTCTGNENFIDGVFMNDTTPNLATLGYTIAFTVEFAMPVIYQYHALASLSAFDAQAAFNTTTQHLLVTAPSP